MATCLQLNAQTITFDGGVAGTGTDWNTAANWVGDVLPGTSNDVDLDGKTVVLSASTQVQRVNIGSSGNLTINSSQVLTITGYTSNDDGLEIGSSSSSVTNNGTILISNIAPAEEGSDGIHLKGSLINNGTITIGTGTGVGQHGIYLQGGTFTNNAAGSLSITNVGVTSLSGGSSPAPDGDGIYIDDNSNSTGGDGATFTNHGSVTITMTDGDDGIYVNDESVFDNENSATLTISGTGSDNGIRVDGSSPLQGVFNNKSGGTLTINATPDDQLFLDDAGEFNNTGSVNLNNAIDGGLLVTDNSVFTNNSGGVLNVTGSTKDGVKLDSSGGTLNNSGTINIDSTSEEGIEIDGGTFNNNNGGILNAIDCVTDNVQIDGGTVINDGHMELKRTTDGSGRDDIEFNGGTFTNNSNATFNPGTVGGYGENEIRGAIDLGSATVTFDIGGTSGASTFDRIEFATSSASLTITNATAHLNWGSYVPNIGDTFKIIDGSGTVSGTFASVTNSNADIVFTVDYVSNTSEVKIEVTDVNSTWTGNDSNDWATAGNWSTGVPSSSMDVTIPSGLSRYPTVTTAETINSLTIASGATLEATNAGFTVSNNASYTRSLASGSQWYLMSSPVNVENFDNAWVTANSIPSSTQDTDNRGISWYDNSSSDTDSDGAGTTDSATGFWRYMAAGDDTPFAVGAGYGIIRSGLGNVEFIGSGIYTADQTRLLATGVNNFNLVGNPFTGFITLGTFHSTNSAVIGTSLYTWNGSSYTTRVSNIADTDNQNFEIAPGQGFFVEASSASNVTFSVSDVSHQGTDTFQKNQNVIPQIKLNLNSANNSRFAKIYYVDGTTKGFDNGYDGKLFGGVSHSFALYSSLVESDGNKYQLQSLPNSNYENMVVPVGVIAEAGKEITFSAEALNLPSGINVYLEDRLNNSYTRLDEANAIYKVTLKEAVEGVGRFYLHTSSKSTLSVDENIALDNISIYKASSTTLRIVGLQQGATNVKIYNVLGKQMMNTSFEANGMKEITLPKVATGVYIVQLETEQGKLSKKIILE